MLAAKKAAKLNACRDCAKAISTALSGHSATMAQRTLAAMSDTISTVAALQ